MTIYSHLERMSENDRRLLNEALGIIAMVKTNPLTEKYIRDRANAFEEEALQWIKRDERFRHTSVAFDLNNLRKGE
jgi:phage gp46-like protein